MRASIRLDTDHHAGEIDRRLFSGFLEHLGRAVYEGVYDPGSPLSDADGFRTDVLDALRRLQMPYVRYPGGNFVSNYDWRDGIGPREKRPARPDFAWKSIEPNTFGVDEFVRWCRKLGAEPMLAVNLGTLGASEAAGLVEYCNLAPGTYWADRRRENGSAEPYGVNLWCLGNEMDGPWQAGHVPAGEYAMRAQQAARLMKGLGPSIELVLCGSSNRRMPTYLEWDRVCLEYCWDDVEYISAHSYSRNLDDDTPSFLAEGIRIDRVLDDYAGLLAYVRGVKKSGKRVHVSFDEWNVWYKDRHGDGRWARAPHLLEEVYNLEDALVCAQYLNSFLRHADTVKVACLAQIVNVIAPVLTRPDGVLIQSNYYPSLLYAEHARGLALVPVVDCPVYAAGGSGEAPTLDVAASHDPEAGRACVFIVNRSPADEAEVSVSFADRRAARVSGVDVLTGDDPKAANSWERPDVVAPAAGSARVDDQGGVRVRVPSLGLAVVRMELARR
ncbi:MAG: alpha-N-arabinofuranosidase [Gemmatimonadetes bacterium]|nr:alpha-N-arabinofuranosidase [Gemmatimonadota bacterium]